MTTVVCLLLIQCALGAFDNLWHHELQARLPQRPAAREELALHCARELIYGVIFIGIAWRDWNGALALLLLVLLAAECAITTRDFVVEDRTRRLPPLERVLHTVMAVNYGAILAFWLPELVRRLPAPSGFAPVDHGLASWLLLLCGIGVAAWGLRDLAAVARLGVPAWQRNPLRRGQSLAPRTILVAGGTGFVGSVLTRTLVERGDRVIVLSREPAWARDRFGPFVEVIGTPDEIAADRHIDAIVNLAGEPLAGGPWTATRKQRFLHSRRDVAGALNGLIARLKHRPEVLVCASAAGFYGERGEQCLDESDGTRDGYLPWLTEACEQAARPAQALGVRVCWLRIGYVLGAQGGMLRQLIPATRLGGGAVLGTGRQWVSWIHVRDLVRLIEHVIAERTLRGPVNAVTGTPLRQREFTRALASALHRPVLVRLPAALLRVLLRDMAQLLLMSQRVAPKRALASGFRFEFETIAAALGDILATRGADVDEGAESTAYANLDCPVCSAEMRRYAQAAARCGARLRFEPVSTAQDSAEYGLGRPELARRMFVRGPARIYSGIDAFLVIWRQLPGFRWLAAVVALPGFRQAAELLYDLVLAPSLTRWNEARRRGAAVREH
jgi:uncharacterized protein (TIGR01777 family)